MKSTRDNNMERNKRESYIIYIIELLNFSRTIRFMRFINLRIAGPSSDWVGAYRCYC